MFIDESQIEIYAGDGGNGCFAYAREKFKPKGKPSGGNGGKGGHVYMIGCRQVQTLQDVTTVLGRAEGRMTAETQQLPIFA